MKQLAWFSCAVVMVLTLMVACTDPTEIGADLLEGDKAEVGFTDTIGVIATTIKTDSILTYFPVFQASEAFGGYPCGNMDDPIFGTSKAQIYGQVSLSATLPDLESAAKVDSIVLVLPYDTSGVYGNTKETYGISVNRLTEDMDFNLSYYSNDSFQSDDANPLANIQFIPNLDSVTIFDYESGAVDTLELPAQLRITLPISFAQELVQLDTSFYVSDSAFISYLKGIHIQPTTVNQGMLSFNLADARAGIYLYYEKTDTSKAQYLFEFNPFRARSVQFEHNTAGTILDRYAGNTSLGDSLIFVQGMAGVNTKIEIPFVKNLKGLVINKAELEVRIASLPGDNLNIFTPVPQIILLTTEDDGDFVTIDDIAILLPQGTTVFNSAYGGMPEEGKPGEPMVYNMNISTHFQRMIDGARPNELYLSVLNRVETPSRVALYGAKHPQYAIKLKVAFTRL
ncbi:MAG: DUF4270 domain-containing protein [Saprospiraceae bacterium]|nr:DUF4270 domain-containing protein [Saprospiraceae bacterium]